MSQILSEAYGHASGEIEILLWKNLAMATHWDRNVVFGALRAIHTWIDCVKPAMALSDQDAGEQTWLLAEARQARKDALDHVVTYIPEDGNPAMLTPIYPKTTTALAPALVIARKYTISGAQDRAQAHMKHPIPIESDNEPLSDEAEEPKSKSRKQSSPELIIIPEDDSPLPARAKVTGKKRSVKVTNEESLAMLNECLKAKVRATQYNNELTVLTNYRNLNIPDLLGPPNTTDHSEYLKEVKNISWSYPAQGNVVTARQYYEDLKVGCKDPEVRQATKDILRHRRMMGIPKDSKAGTIRCRYVIRVLRDIDGQTVDAGHSKYGRDWNIGLYDIVSPMSTKKIEKNGSFIYMGRTISGKVTYRYCPFCSYATTNHRELNNHIRMHLHLTLGCRMPDCWFMTHSSDTMWKHAASHGLETVEPITNAKRK